jgi:hypothetical protein
MNAIEALTFLNDKTANKAQSKMIKRWRDVYYSMSLHTTGACPKFKDLSNNGGWLEPPNYFGEEYQKRFNKFLMSKHPREHEDSRQWRFSAYKPLTRAPFQQVSNIVTGAIFQDSNYSIEIQNEDDNNYIWNNNFEGHDLVGWFANIGAQSCFEDPNGMIVTIPSKPYYQQTGGKVDVSVLFVNTKDIVYSDASNLVFKYNNYAFWIDDITIFRYTFDPAESKYYLAPEDVNGYYAHMFGRLPLDVAGGIWSSQKFYESFFLNAQAVADEFVSSYSAQQMIDKEASHPFITMANDECPTCHGVKQIQITCDVTDTCPNGLDLVDCGTCSGKGTVSVNPGDRYYTAAENMDKDMVKITNPEISINKYHHDKNNDIYEKILHALNLYKTDKAESGEAKAIDQERLYQFISKISNHFFDKLIYGTLYNIIAYRNVSSVNGRPVPSVYQFSVVKPTQYQIKTAKDLLEEYKAGKDSAMPSFVRSKMVTDYVDKQYSGDRLMKKKAVVVLEMDDLSVRSEDELLTMSTIGTVSKEDLIFSRKLPSILDTIIRLKGEAWFVEAEFDPIKLEVDRLFEPFKPKSLFVVDELSPDTA